MNDSEEENPYSSPTAITNSATGGRREGRLSHVLALLALTSFCVGAYFSFFGFSDDVDVGERMLAEA